MKISRSSFLFALVCLLVAGGLVFVADARRPAKTKPALRVLFSGNIEGELDPCG